MMKLEAKANVAVVVVVVEVVVALVVVGGGARRGEGRGLLSLSLRGASSLSSLVNIPEEASTPDTQSTISRETNTLDKSRRWHLQNCLQGLHRARQRLRRGASCRPPPPPRPEGNAFFPEGPALVFSTVITFLIPLPGAPGGKEEVEKEEEKEGE
ncbi:hypothetical protein E2C01_016531 [Portunus trituberculatus]|uniref:Uncharacterized protein n=1 Tax=Portunus trituberculatus TaxID=210409 RepID=A0A5B7DPA6_PORTR|nr:hypothetical protein [Portunus trituberculatus]